MSAGALWAQAKPDVRIGTKPLNETGTIEAVQGDTIKIKTDKDAWWLIKAPHGQTKISVEGTAEPSFLRPGVNVRFSGTINDKGVLRQRVDKLEIYTPKGKASSGLFADGAGEDAKPAKKFAAGAYEIRGRVSSLKDNHLIVAAGGKKIVGDIAPDVDINARLEDLTHVQPGDKIKVTGYYYERDQPDLRIQRPGGASALEVVVTLANPLSIASKRAGKSAKAAGARRGTPAADPQDAGDAREPMGDGKGSKPGKRPR
jgi:hypothetical protein